MTLSSIKNILSRGSIVIGALALVGTVGCAAQDDLTAEDTASPEAVATVSSELSEPDIHNAPYVNDWESREWQVYGNDQWLNSWTWYSTYDSYYNEYMDYGYQEYGVDLAFYDHDTGHNYKYENHSHGELHYGDDIAIWVKGHGYLYYYNNGGHGMELRYSWQPVYQWEFHGGEYGHRIPTGHKVEIYNLYRHEDMVYCDRGCGADLSWENECHDYQEHRYDDDYFYSCS